MRTYAFSGSHGTGKTTTLNKVKTVLEKESINCLVVSEQVRSNPYPVNKSGEFKSQMWNTVSYIKEELEIRLLAEKVKTPIILMDRCVLDGLAYALYLHESKNINDQELLYYQSVIFNWITMVNYDSVFMHYADPELWKEFGNKDDGFREFEDTNFFNKVQENVRSLLPYYRMGFNHVYEFHNEYKGKDLEEWVNMVVDAIKSDIPKL